MANYSLVLSNNIDCPNVYDYLNKVLAEQRTLFLTATQGLKRIRKANDKLKFNNDSFLETYSELKEKVFEEVRQGPRFISRADQKFILTQVIKSMFSGERQIAFYKIRNDLFELYEFMLGEEISHISDETISKIATDFTATEKDIFEIYNKYQEVLFEIQNGKTPTDIEIDRVKVGTHVKLLSELINHNLFNQVDNFDTIVFDGFLFFNEEQKKLLLDAIIKEKNLIFIAKTMESDKDNFLLNKLFKPLAKEFDIKLDIVNIQSEDDRIDNAISFVRNNYLDFSKKPTMSIDEGFKFIEPFTSRDRELNYIINCIAKYIKSTCNDNKGLICKTLANDIAIVIANEKDKYEHQLNVLLKENGVFFLNEESEIIDQFETGSLKPVLYRRNEFVEGKIKTKYGKTLSRQEKIVAFRKLYKGINISSKARSFINYPIGQYILEIYRIVNEGMSCEGFKKILYSNWYYNVGLETIKYDKFIKEFQYIEPYLYKKKTPAEWVEELNKIKEIKSSLNKNIENRFNPLKSISFEALDFLITQINDTKLMVDNLSKVFGDVNEHLKALKDNFLLDDILSNPNFTNEFEREVIKHLKEIIDGINKSSLVTNIDSKYFSDNIRNMLTDYEREKAESAADELTLNVVNMENMQKFKLTFFCMLEEDKYPRQYSLNFPYTENILEILENPKYEIECKPDFIKTLDYHMELEKFLFLNVLDFTQEQMVITQTEEENGKDLSNSIYIEDIFSMFQQDIKYTKLKDSNTKTDTQYTLRRSVMMSYEDNSPISLTDMCSYFLCPKIYYYLTNKKMENEISYSNEWKLNIYIPSLLYYKTLYKIGLEGKQNQYIYSLNNSDFATALKQCLDESLKEELYKFDFLSNYDKKDIKARTEAMLNAFVKRNFYDKGVVFFTLDLSNSETFKIINEMGKEINVRIDNCLIIKDVSTGYSYNFDISSQMDFLVKSAGGESHAELTHFEEIFEKLSEKNPFDDRMALISYMFFKLNVQLNTKKFRNDGLKRLKGLSRYITRQLDENYIPSSYCRYCKFESICKMKERGAQ